MCGIVGLIAKGRNGLTIDEQDAFTDALYIDALRGKDSTGVFTVDIRADLVSLKQAAHAASFINTEEYRKWATQNVASGIFVVGHNRAATRGGISDETAHPFLVEDTIMLVHNGTLRGDHKKHADVAVDSEAIAHLLYEEPDVAKALSKINGAYALVWYDTRNDTLNLIKNDERPLCIVDFSDGTVMFGSEGNILICAAGRNKIPTKDFNFTHCASDVLYQYTFSRRGGVVATTEKLTITPPTSMMEYVDGYYCVGNNYYRANKDDWVTNYPGRGHSTHVSSIGQHPHVSRHVSTLSFDEVINGIYDKYKSTGLQSFCIPLVEANDTINSCNLTKPPMEGSTVEVLDYFSNSAAPPVGSATHQGWFVVAKLLEAVPSRRSPILLYWNDNGTPAAMAAKYAGKVDFWRLGTTYTARVRANIPGSPTGYAVPFLYCAQDTITPIRSNTTEVTS
jgi:predicted glutamine amidotransferase